MTSLPSVPDGFRFECQPGCVKCCDRRGYVYITENDLLRIAAFLGMTPAAFEAKYVYRTTRQIRLRKPRHSECHFLRTDVTGRGGCDVHSVKPVQCRTYPFWPELVESRDLWELEACKCPGIGQGPLIQIGAAMEVAEVMKTAYPCYYPKLSG
ncbi:MAG: YkgJ family cysteine cluster protein [Bryobacteraceae bacterium]|nr:YkgJ family cysteine cluster protein [Bryobacteraceae bacterium]